MVQMEKAIRQALYIDEFPNALSEKETLVFTHLCRKWLHELKQYKEKVVQDIAEEVNSDAVVGKPFEDWVF
jgi:inactivated superfamily I helicase